MKKSNSSPTDGATKHAADRQSHSAKAGHALKECPFFLTLSLIANKWCVRILFCLLQAEKKTLRFSQLQKTMGGITQRELTKHLREFEKAGIVQRTVYPQIPPRVEYTVTALGDSLLKPIEELSRWAEDHGEKVQKNRQAFAMRVNLT